MVKQTPDSGRRVITLLPKREKVNRSKAEKIIIWTVFVFLVVYAITLIYPFFYLLLNSYLCSTSCTIVFSEVPNR